MAAALVAIVPLLVSRGVSLFEANGHSARAQAVLARPEAPHTVAVAPPAPQPHPASAGGAEPRYLPTSRVLLASSP